MNYNECLDDILRGRSLSRAEARALMDGFCDLKIASEQAGAFLAALRIKQESVDEISGFADSLRARAIKVPSTRKDLIDVCGTGGDGLGTFNISTAVAFVVGACGLGVAKHGNRSVSSRSGSTDVLEALGVPVLGDPVVACAALDGNGLGFLSAPAFHPVLKAFSTLRKNLGVRTVFNVLGPLLNPAPVKRQLIGVFSPLLLVKMAEVLRELGAEEVMIVHGHGGLDELSLSGPTEVAHLKNGEIKRIQFAPEDCGLDRADLRELAGGEASENAQTIRDIFENKISGPRKDVVVFNAAAALVVGGKAGDLREGAQRAASAIETGRALKLLVKAGARS